MATSALIVLDDESFQPRVFGLGWLEFMLRRIAASGIANVVVVVERVPPALGETVEKLRRGGVRCTVARSTDQLADLFHPDEIVLLMGGTVLPSCGLVTEFAAADRSVLLCLPNGQGHHFERIDAVDDWTGVATVTGTHIRAVAATPGDWNAASALLRVAVQSGVDRRQVDPADIFEADRRLDVRLFEAQAIRWQPRLKRGWGTRLVAGPAARLVARLVASHLAVSVLAVPVLAIVLSLAAVLIALMTSAWAAPAAGGLILLASIALLTGRLAAAATALPDTAIALARRSVPAVAAVAVVVVTWPDVGSATATPLTLGLCTVGLTWICTRDVTTALPSPSWMPDLPGQAILVAALSAAFGATVAFAAAAVHAVVSLVWTQNRVSELLRSRH